MSIEAEVFEQAKKRARRRGFLFALLLVFLVLVTLITINSFLELERRSPHIARIKIDGPISNDINFNWNGKHKGEELPPQVFHYYCEILCSGGKKLFKKGNITLIK